MATETTPIIWKEVEVKENKVQIISLTEDRIDEAASVIRKEFIPREKLCLAFDVASDPIACDDFTNLAAKGMKDNLSVIAVEKETNNIIGVSVIGLTKKSEGITFKSSCGTRESSRCIFTVLYELCSAVNIFEEYNVNCYAESLFFVVTRQYASGGLGLEIARSNFMLLKLLKSSDIECVPKQIVAIVTCEESYRLSKRMNFKEIYRKSITSCFLDCQVNRDHLKQDLVVFIGDI